MYAIVLTHAFHKVDVGEAGVAERAGVGAVLDLELLWWWVIIPREETRIHTGEVSPTNGVIEASCRLGVTVSSHTTWIGCWVNSCHYGQQREKEDCWGHFRTSDTQGTAVVASNLKAVIRSFGKMITWWLYVGHYMEVVLLAISLLYLTLSTYYAITIHPPPPPSCIPSTMPSKFPLLAKNPIINPCHNTAWSHFYVATVDLQRISG